MITSAAGIAFIQEFESLSLIAYPDPLSGGDPWTCGHGITGPDICEGTVWTLDYANRRFEKELAAREAVVNREITVPLTQGQFDALVSLLWNVGYGSKKKDGIFRLKNGKPSTLVRLLNSGDYRNARAEFLRWISRGTRVENGLRRRRIGEVALWDARHDLTGKPRLRIDHLPPRPMPPPPTLPPRSPSASSPDELPAPIVPAAPAAPAPSGFLALLARLFGGLVRK